MEVRTRGIRNPALELTRPVSEARKKSMDKRNEKISMAQKGIGLTTKEWRALTPEARTEAKAALDGIEDMAYIQRAAKAKRSPIERMRKWVGGKMEGEVVPEGWLYAIQNPDLPHIIKIGRTFPDGLQDRLGEAQRWGRAEIIGQNFFDDVNEAERVVHASLAKWNLRNLGFSDCGKELFKCSRMNYERAVGNHIADITEALLEAERETTVG